MIDPSLYTEVLQSDFMQLVGLLYDTHITLAAHGEPLDPMRFLLKAIFPSNPQLTRHSAGEYTSFNDPLFATIFDIFHLCEHGAMARRLQPSDGPSDFPKDVPKFMTVSVDLFPPSIFTILHNIYACMATTV